MYLFRDKDEIIITLTCKLCLRKLGLKISRKEFESTKEFPITKEIIHGENPHKLIVHLDRNLEVSDFEISEVSNKQEISYSKKLAKEVLKDLELSEDEIELYFLSTGRDVISIGEMALLIDKPKEECQEIARKFVKKGLYKEIIGVTPHYTPIPPYAALIKQLSNFQGYIENIKETAPIQLEESFSKLETQAEGVKNLREYTKYINEMREKMLSIISEQEGIINKSIEKILKIEKITANFKNLEKSTEELVNEQMIDLEQEFKRMNKEISKNMEDQIEELENKYDQINSDISMILEGQINSLEDDYQTIKNRVKNNLSKLHLGIVQKTVEKVIDKVFKDWLDDIRSNLQKELGLIKKSLNKGLEDTENNLKENLGEIEDVSEESLKKTTNRFDEKFLKKLQESIKELGTSVKNITNDTIQSGEKVKEVFTDTSENFNSLVSEAEVRIEGISENILQSFGDLKEIFSTRVISTLRNVLHDITERLEISETTTKQFWEQAKQVSVYTMKDIWFIRSIESVKSHINELLTKAKMRVLIVAPEITDIDPVAIRSCPTHVNIRIASFIDTSLETHNEVLDQLDDMHNVSYRHRELKNIWGINRDHEEVILCVISRTEVKGKEKIEIGGIGSVVEEDIKIFVPILEDAWVASQKMVPRTKKARGEKISSEKSQSTIKTKKKAEIPKSTKPEKQIFPEITKQQKSEEIKADNKSKSVMNLLKSHEIKKPSEKKDTKQKEKPIKQEKAVPPQAKTSSDAINSDLMGDLKSTEDILNYFKLIESKLDSLTGIEISKMLENLSNAISEVIGYSRVLDTIKKSSQDLSSISNQLNEGQKADFLKRIQFWKKKLNL